jgi:hypothetical protein
MKILDYVVIGSGCSGAMVAQTLVEAGLPVTMLDVGVTPEKPLAIPKKDYATIRRTEEDQYRYFIGEDASGVVWGDIGKGAQITPPRSHLAKLVDRYLPIKSSTFSPLESLAYGGLGVSWGLQSWEYSAAELKKAGLDADRMQAAYEVVSQRIGVSATKDDASAYTMGSLKTFQPSAALDRNHQIIYRKYQRRQDYFNRKHIFMSRTPLALLTKDLGKRKKYAYRDMDFYSDKDQSAWRPWITVNALRKHRNFDYRSGYLLLNYQEGKQDVKLICIEVATQKRVTFRAKTVVLATNPLNAARIVLRSNNDYTTRLPLLCNPYTYVPCLQPRMVGKGIEPKKLGFAQLTMFLDEAKNGYDLSVASLYSYQSLMLFRIIRQLPFNYRDARMIMRYLMTGLVIMGIHHPDAPSKHKYLQLQPDESRATGDYLKAHYQLSDTEQISYRKREKKSIAAGRQLGLYALARINPGYGSSIHYAGTLPFSTDEQQPYALSPNGRLHGTKRIYVADSSGFTFLPAKGLTFSLLANAHLVAENIINER